IRWFDRWAHGTGRRRVLPCFKPTWPASGWCFRLSFRLKSFLLRGPWGRRVLRPLGLPLLHLIRLVGRSVQLDQPIEGLWDAEIPGTRDGLLASLHSFVALQQQRFGLGVLLLAQQRTAEHRLRIERAPNVRLQLLAKGHALTQDRLGLDELVQLHE